MARPFAGSLAILVAATLLAISVSHVLSPEEHRLSAGPAVMWPAIAENATWSRLLSLEWLVAGLLALAVVPAASDRVRRVAPDAVRWGVSLGLLGFATQAVSSATELARLGPFAAAYVQGDRSVQTMIAANPVVPLDPFGLLTFGGIGSWLVIVSAIGLRARSGPAALDLLGLASGIMFWLVVPGIVTGTEALITVAAGLGGTVLGPAWFVWTGVRLVRGAVGHQAPADAPAVAGTSA
jgi:hypothetical protein